MYKVILAVFLLCIATVQPQATGVPTADPFLFPMKCGSYRYGWLYSCLTTANKWTKIFPIKTWYADCKAAPTCPYNRRCFASEITADVADRAAAEDPFIKTVPYKYWGWRCVQTSYKIVEAFVYDCTFSWKMVQCKIPTSCNCQCYWILPWDDVSYLPEAEAVFD